MSNEGKSKEEILDRLTVSINFVGVVVAICALAFTGFQFYSANESKRVERNHKEQSEDKYNRMLADIARENREAAAREIDFEIAKNRLSRIESLAGKINELRATQISYSQAILSSFIMQNYYNYILKEFPEDLFLLELESSTSFYQEEHLNERKKYYRLMDQMSLERATLEIIMGLRQDGIDEVQFRDEMAFLSEFEDEYRIISENIGPKYNYTNWGDSKEITECALSIGNKLIAFSEAEINHCAALVSRSMAELNQEGSVLSLNSGREGDADRVKRSATIFNTKGSKETEQAVPPKSDRAGG